MILKIYKPNSKNTGHAFNFSIGSDQKTEEPVVFMGAIKQSGWDNTKKTGDFKNNAKNPEKSTTVKLGEFECGEIISSLKNRHEWGNFHDFAENKTTIKFTPWDKPRTIKFKNPKTNKYEEKKITVPAFGISISRTNDKGSQYYQLPLEPGEAEALKVFLNLALRKTYEHRIEKFNSYNKEHRGA